MKAKEIHEMDEETLKAEVVQTEREKLNLRFQHATRQLTTTHRLKVVKKKIARLLTILHKKAG